MKERVGEPVESAMLSFRNIVLTFFLCPCTVKSLLRSAESELSPVSSHVEIQNKTLAREEGKHRKKTKKNCENGLI